MPVPRLGMDEPLRQTSRPSLRTTKSTPNPPVFGTNFGTVQDPGPIPACRRLEAPKYEDSGL